MPDNPTKSDGADHRMVGLENFGVEVDQQDTSQCDLCMSTYEVRLHRNLTLCKACYLKANGDLPTDAGWREKFEEAVE